MLTIKTVNGCGKQCAEACQRCTDCEGESRGWSDCWKNCDECNRCMQRAYNSNRYGKDPYYPDNVFAKPAPNFNHHPIAKQFCDNVCGVPMCKAYRRRQEGYNQCKRCEQQGLCWSEYQSKCIDCPVMSHGAGHCEAKWGSPNPMGAQFNHVPPINPMYTNCQGWWNPAGYTT